MTIISQFSSDLRGSAAAAATACAVTTTGEAALPPSGLRSHIIEGRKAADIVRRHTGGRADRRAYPMGCYWAGRERLGRGRTGWREGDGTSRFSGGTCNKDDPLG